MAPRAVRRRLPSELADEPGHLVIAVAQSLLDQGPPGASVVAYELVRYHPEAEGQLGARELTEALDEGWKSFAIAERFPLARIADAHQAVERSAARGRALLNIT